MIRKLIPVTALAALALAAPASATAPKNDDFATPTILGTSAQPADVEYTTNSASVEANEPGGVSDSWDTVWFKWTPATAGAAYAEVCDDQADHKVQVYRVKPGQLKTLTTLELANATNNAFMPPSTVCRFRWRAAKDVNYYIQIINGGSDLEKTLHVDQDTTPPAVPAIDPAWPATTGPDHTATFTGEAGATFLCALDAPKFWSCESPMALTSLHETTHAFAVRAIDAHGNLSTDADMVTWDVVKPQAEPVVDPLVSPVQDQRTTEPGGGGSTTTQTTTTTTTTTPPPPACTLRLSAPKRASRAALRRGLRVKVNATGAGCATKLSLRQGRRVLAGAKVAPEVVLKTKRARRGRVTIVAGGVKRTVKVT